MTSTGAGVRARHHQTLLGAGLLGFAWLALRTAWVSDDAFISLRTAANWLGGHGLTWNPGERVQTFTHPLWLFALTAAHALTGEPFYSTLYLSAAVSCAAVATLLFAPVGGVAEKLSALLVLAFSEAFVDFSSSGLENPLTHLLIAAFAAVYFARPPSPARSAWLAGIAGAGALNRLDTVLLFAPALASCVSRATLKRDLLRLSWSALPIAIWEAFSILYYGFPFPNTAYAKLAQSQGRATERVVAGLSYVADSLAADPLTLCAIAGCIAVALRHRDAQRLWLLAGAVLYVAYTISIGGDFMSGRFFAAPLFIAMFCLATSDWLPSAPERIAVIGLVVALALLGRAPPPFTGADYGASNGKPVPPQTAIHDERAMFFAISSLRNAQRMNPGRSDHPWAITGRKAKAAAAADPRTRVHVIDAIGYAGYYAGPDVHIVDHWALADALIARLPSVFGMFGHYPRAIPQGYIDTLRGNINRIADPQLAAYYDRLALVVRGPLWSARRMRAIWKFNTGGYDALLDGYAYLHTQRFAPRVRLHNPTDYPCVTTYVWNDWRKSEYMIDASSTRDATYALAWEITPAGAQLRAPAARQRMSFRGLRERDTFSIAVAFSQAPEAPVRAIYELRYRYTLANGGLVIQREPWPASNTDFPTGRWRDHDISDVIEIVP